MKDDNACIKLSLIVILIIACANLAVADHKTGVTLRVIATAIKSGKVDPERPHMPNFKNNVCRSCHAMSEEREQKIREAKKNHPDLQDADAWCLACHDGILASNVSDNHKTKTIENLVCIDEEELTQPTKDASEPGDKPRLTACSACHDIHQTKDATALLRPSIQNCSEEETSRAVGN